MGKCPRCGFKAERLLQTNLYKCNSCGIQLSQNHTVVFPIVLSDLRRFNLKWSDGFREYYTIFSQLDLLRLIRLSRFSNNSTYEEKFKNLIYNIDKFNKEETDFVRKLPRVYLTHELEKRGWW